jgi:hypothetical protein
VVDIAVYPCVDCGRPTQRTDPRALCDPCLADREDLLRWYLRDEFRHLFPANWRGLPAPSGSAGRRPPRRGERAYDEARLRRLLDDW